MSANVIVLIDPNLKDTEVVVKELSKAWQKDVAFTLLELSKEWTAYLFSDEVTLVNTLYLVRPSHSHGKARIAFALSKALWKRPAAVLCFYSAEPAEEFLKLTRTVVAMGLPIKSFGLTKEESDSILEAYATLLS